MRCIHLPTAAFWGHFCAALLLWTATGCGGLGDGSKPAVAADPCRTAPAGIPNLQGTVTQTCIQSHRVGAGYPILVYLPPGYARNTQKIYPVIYGLDGQAVFETLGDGSTRFTTMVQVLESQGIEAIVVGIGYTDPRNIDYVWPGAKNFYDFIAQELIPAIEPQYRVDPSNRSIGGHSLGGWFVNYAMTRDRPTGHLFSHFISQDGTNLSLVGLATSNPSGAFGAMADDPYYGFENAMHAASGGNLPGTTLILSGTSQGNKIPVAYLHDALQRRNYRGLDMRHFDYALTHEAMFKPSFTESVQTIFKILPLSGAEQRTQAAPG